MRSMILTLITLGLLSAGASAQSSEPDQRLRDHFSDVQLSKMKHEMPSRVDYWNYFLDHSITIVDISAEKAGHLEGVEMIEQASEGFHALTIPLDEFRTEGATFRFQGEDRLLIVKPMKQFIEEFNAHSKVTQ